MNEHPSFLALDGSRLGVPLSPAQRQHVEACAVCAAYLTALAAPVAAPAWLRGVAWPPPPARASRGTRSLPWSAIALAAGAAVVLVVALPRRAPQPAHLEETVREKGGPTVTVVVKRGAEVFVWDGHRPVRPHDQIGLRLGGGGYHHVSVASAPLGRPAVVLYEGPLGDGPALLPRSFRVDERFEDGQERLSIILGHQPIAPGWHDTEGGEAADEAREIFRQLIVLAKEREGTQHD